MKYEHRVLNWNVEAGYVDSFNTLDKMVTVYFEDIIGKTEIGSNQYKVKVFINDSEDVIILDMKNKPLQLHRSLVPKRFNAKSMREAYENEWRRRIKVYQELLAEDKKIEATQALEYANEIRKEF